jgi:hypothetical protein
VKRARKSRKKSKRPSAKVRKEAQHVYDFVLAAEELAGKLIWKFAKKNPDQSARSTLQFDYHLIAKSLAAGDPDTRGGPFKSPLRGIWGRYAHHFQNARSRRNLFNKIDSIAKRYLGSVLYSQANAALEGNRGHPPNLVWDETLFPITIAPSILRQWIQDNRMFRDFMAALFRHFQRFHKKGSVGRRITLALQFAPKVGWKPQRLTEKLVQTGDINLGHHEYKADRKQALDRQSATVGKSLRRIRHTVKARDEALAQQVKRQRQADEAAAKAAGKPGS